MVEDNLLLLVTISILTQMAVVIISKERGTKFILTVLWAQYAVCRFVYDAICVRYYGLGAVAPFIEYYIYIIVAIMLYLEGVIIRYVTREDSVFVRSCKKIRTRKSNQV